MTNSVSAAERASGKPNEQQRDRKCKYEGTNENKKRRHIHEGSVEARAARGTSVQSLQERMRHVCLTSNMTFHRCFNSGHSTMASSRMRRTSSPTKRAPCLESRGLPPTVPDPYFT